MINQEPPSQDQLQSARKLWFGSYHGILSSHSIALPGFPFGSLVPLCRAPDGIPLLLLSHLAQHTQNLDTNPHCSLLLQERGDSDIQQLGRLTCLAETEKVESISSEISERFFRFFPDTRTYYEDLNFNFYRLKPVRFYFVGGFGAARWFDISRLLTTLSLSSQEESNLLAKLNALLQAKCPAGSTLNIVGVDCMGLDLRSNEQFERLMLPEPIHSINKLLPTLESSLENRIELKQNTH